MPQQPGNLKRSPLLFVLLFTAAFLLVMFLGSSTPAMAQGTPTTRADAIVLVNSTSASYPDFAHYIQPYLDHFGVPYTTLDIATASIPTDLGSYALIVVGHNQLDPGHLYLDSTEQTLISTAVNQGTGLVNFDQTLADSSNAPLYSYIQNIFGFGYATSAASTAVVVNSGASLGNYVVAAQANNAQYTLNGSITPRGITVPLGASTLVSIGSQPLLIAGSYGQGRAIQWTSYDWMRANIWGYVRGFDDLIWRGLIWAARKPFVMQGLPPFVTMRVDDGSGPYDWVTTANQYQVRPWVGIFLADQDATDSAYIKQAVDAGNMTVSTHARNNDTWFYFDHMSGVPFSDQAIAQNFADATAWHNQYQIPISKVVVPHYYEIGPNAFSGLRDWGVEYIVTMVTPGNRYYDSQRLLSGPFNRYETPCAASCGEPLYYADYLDIPGHPEFNGQFFNINTEIRDNAGYEWYPSNDVPLTIQRGTAQLKRAFDGMELAILFTHEQYIQLISSSNWNTILAGVTANIASYQPEYVTLDHAAQYVRAIHNSAISSSIYDAGTEQLNTTLSGSTDMPTRFYMFTDQSGVIQGTFVNVPAFSNSVVVSSSTVVPTPTPTFTPTATPTGSTTTPITTPTATPTTTSGGEIRINVYEDSRQSPVLTTTTSVADLVENDNQWTEFYYSGRGYPGVFASYNETAPLMRFYGDVPNGTYTVVANLYRNSNLRYYWGYDAYTPEANSYEVTSGTIGEFSEYTIGSVTVTNGVFNLYTRRADQLTGGGSYPFYGWAWIRLIPGVATPTPTHTPGGTPTATDTPLPTNTPTPGGTIQFNVYEDSHQSPVLTTTTSVADLVENDNQWTEFYYSGRGYPGVFAGYNESAPLMRFYGDVPNGTYTVVANLYRNSNLRYYWGYDASNPEANSYDVTTGTVGEFSEYTIGSVTVTNGVFNLYTRRADQLTGGGSYSFYGWAWIRLIPDTPTATPTNTPVPTNTPTVTATNTPVPPTNTPTATATNTPVPPTNTPTATPTNTPVPPNTPTATATPANTLSCQVGYSVRDDWGNGATVDLTITNTGGSNIDGWTLAWTFPGNQQITNLWNGNSTQNGQNVSVTNMSYNAAISAGGGSVLLGFNVSYSGANTSPSRFTVNGVPCASNVILPTTTPMVTATATNTPIPPTATPTPTATPVVGQDGWSRIEAESYNSSGGSLQVCGWTLCYVGANAWTQYNSVNLPTGTNTVQMSVANGGVNTGIQVWVGGVNVGALTVGNTGGWNTYQIWSLTLPAQSGVKDVRLVFVNGSVNVDWFVFSGSSTVLQNGVYRASLSGAQGSQTYFTMNVPAGATNLQFRISGGSGNANLYVRFGSRPTLSSYNCRPYLSGNNETCTFSVPQVGTYYVMLHGYTSYSEVNLVGIYQGGLTTASEVSPVQIYLPIIVNGKGK